MESTIAELKANKIAQSAPTPQNSQSLPSENALEAFPIKTLVRSDVKPRQSSTGKVAPQNYGVLPPNATEGLSQTALCNFYGLSWRNLKRNSAIARFDSLEAYLEQMTGINWTQGKISGMTKLYFPVVE